MTSSEAPKPWEAWHARFDFSEGKGYKYRPVIVVEVATDGSIVMMVTSTTNKLYKISKPHMSTRVIWRHGNERNTTRIHHDSRSYH